MHLNESTRLRERRERRERLPELMVEERRKEEVLESPNSRRGAIQAGGGLPGGESCGGSEEKAPFGGWGWRG